VERGRATVLAKRERQTAQTHVYFPDATQI